MIERKMFYTKYDVYDGMSNTQLTEQSMLAKKTNLDRLNIWIASEAESIKRIINIQETSYSSFNSDNSPFWEKLICFYETN